MTSAGTPTSPEPARPTGAEAGQPTSAPEYTERLTRLQGARWKASPLVQLPFRAYVMALRLGRCLDVGCGVGRLLRHMAAGSVGIDHNPTSVEVCRQRGLVAYATAELDSDDSARLGIFDSILLAHVLEHVSGEVGDALIENYLPWLGPTGKVVVITPQEVGQRSDPTHVRWVDHGVVREHASRLGLTVEATYSFPFPRPFGRIFIYNEFITVLRAA